MVEREAVAFGEIVHNVDHPGLGTYIILDHRCKGDLTHNNKYFGGTGKTLCRKVQHRNVAL